MAQQLGQPWRVTQQAEPVEGTVHENNANFVIALDGLSTDQVYGLYVLSEDGSTLWHQPGGWRTTTGHFYKVFDLPVGAAQIVVSDPPSEGNTAGVPSEEPSGEHVFVAER